MVLMRTIVRLRRFSSDPTLRGQVGHRRLVAQLAAQRFAGGIELAALAADAARPGVLAQRVDHRAAHAPFGEGLELDAALLVEAMGRVDQPEHAVLHQIADVDGVRHRGRHAARQRFDERQAPATIRADWSWRRRATSGVSLCQPARAGWRPLSQPRYQLGRPCLALSSRDARIVQRCR